MTTLDGASNAMCGTVNELADATEALLAALQRTETYKRYAALRESVMADEINRKLLTRFTQAQAALQTAALSGVEPRGEDVSTFEKLSELTYQSDELSEYLLAQMRVQQLAAQVMERLSRAVGLEVDLPGL